MGIIDLNNVKIKEASTNDFEDVMNVEKAAFGCDKEANWVAKLLEDESAKPYLSLLAFYNGEAVGHILFTKAHVNGCLESPIIYILAPLAIKPEFQKNGIGGLLIKAGLQILREKGAELVFVLGHKEYYPRYGFEQNAQGRGFLPPYPDPVPEEYSEYWMVQSLTPKGFNFQKGKLICADALYKPEHWRE